ncbi:Rv3235 family protein [Mycolicibacterium celeriflavum]|uniref:Rv3235 family protein n=1 Tax=Mycolicibacterium celeriflavum TaxID=1249101 RepID=UPI003CE92A68
MPPEPAPPRDAVVFADAALRRVFEVIDRRRPLAQLRPLLTPALIESVLAMTRHPHATVATLRRVRLRVIDGGTAAEVFGTYRRGQRIRAVAARIAFDGRRWRVVALQIG